MTNTIYIGTSLDGYIADLPVLLGDGVPLFGKFDGPRRFRLKASETYLNSFNVRYYVRER